MSIEKTLEQEGPLGRKLTVHIGADAMQQARSQSLRDIGSNVQLPGFRKGKVPASVLERQYGQRANQESAERMVQQSLSDAMHEEKLHPVGMPEVKIIESQQQGGLSYCASFDIFPKADMASVDKLEVLRPVCEVGEQDVETGIERLKSKYPVETRVEREARMGDAVDCILLVDTADGNKNEPRRERMLLEDRMEKDVLDFLVGSAAGAKGEVAVDDPKGGKLQLQITVESVYELSPPELNDDFFTRLGVPDFNSLRTEIGKTLEHEARHLQGRLLWKRVCAALCKQHKDMDLPEKLVSREAEAMKESGMDEAKAKQAAADAIREHLLIELYVAEHKLEPSPQEVRSLVERAASGHDNPKAYVDWHYADSSRLHNYRWAAMQNRVLTHMTQQADFATENISFADLAKELS